MLLSKKKRSAREKQMENKQEGAVQAVQDIDRSSEVASPACFAEKRVRLSCDITRSRHRQLKVHAAETGRTIVEVVEDLIGKNCFIDR